MFTTVKEMVDAEDYAVNYTWRKSPSQVTTAGVWFDLSMSPGNPVPQYYAASPLVSVLFKQSTDGGLYHGSNNGKKYLRSTLLMSIVSTALPMPMMLLDYLMYYPFIDEGTTDEQALTNSATLSRYTTGKGVQIMAVSVAGRTGGQSFTVKYTNQDGVTDRVTNAVIQNTAAANGSIVSSQTNAALAAGPFLPLQNGDTGVRSIQSVTMLGTDVGLFSLVLVKPLASTQLRGIDAPVEKDYFLETGTAPEIQDDAYLNWICLPAGTMAATNLHGMIKTTFK